LNTAAVTDQVRIDGRWGEGGGQVLRTALTLAVALQRPFAVDHIRANRSKPGLRPQHLTAVRMMAELTEAEVDGDRLSSTTLTFRPNAVPTATRVRWDVASHSRGGSAGSLTLLLQTLLPAAPAGLRFSLWGGTHVPWSPPYHYLEWVHLPLLSQLGWRIGLHLDEWGFYPVGKGRVTGEVSEVGARAVDLRARGALREVTGLSVAACLPEHIAQRQATAATALLRDHGIDGHVTWAQVKAACAGTAVVLAARSDETVGGASALGKRGLPAEEVGRSAARDLLAYLSSGAALDAHQGDQLLVPAMLCKGDSVFTVARVTSHLVTNARVINAFTGDRVRVQGKPGEQGTVWVRGSRS
jgi:RNA 3'-terminal phosphate cyclase (ATP)